MLQKEQLLREGAEQVPLQLAGRQALLFVYKQLIVIQNNAHHPGKQFCILDLVSSSSDAYPCTHIMQQV